MSIKHKIKLTFSRIRDISSISLRALKYKNEIKDIKWLIDKKKVLTLELLGFQRINQDSEEIRELKAKIDIINEILSICS